MKRYYRPFFVIIAIILEMVCVKNTVQAQNNDDIAKISQVVLYYPNSVMENRINVTDLSNYLKNIVKCYNEYLLLNKNHNEASAIIVFAINQNHMARIWLVDNYSNSNNNELNNLFKSIGIPVVNNGPIAVAIYIGNYNGLNVKIDKNGIYIPDEWMEIINNNSTGQPMSIDPVINKVAEYFHSDIIEEDYSLNGYVTMLHQEEGAIEGDITLATWIEGKRRKVRMKLKPNEYIVAVNAHRDRQQVICKGTLSVQDRMARLSEVTSVLIFEEEE